MAQYLSNIDLSKNQLQNAALHPVATTPGTPVEGQVYFDTTPGDKKMYYYNGTAWVFMGSQGDITAIQSSTTSQLTVTNGTGPIPSLAIITGAVANGGTALATGDQIYDFVVGQGYVESVGRANSTFVNLVLSGTATNPVLTASLSASGTPGSGNFLRGDNTWAAPPAQYTSWILAGDSGSSQAITDGNTATFAGGTNISTVASATDTLTVNLNDSITLAGTLTVNGTGQSSFAGQVTIPATPTANTDAASKQYVDNSVVGNLVYQGGYNAATNTPDLDSSPSSSIKKGWTYTVTADGSFFTEQVRVGDVLIAEVNAPTTLADWTTVQNNIDLATLSTVGIGNVNPGEGIDVSYSNGTATVSGEDSSATNKGIVIVGAGTGISVAYSSGTATVTNTETNSNSTFAATITSTGAVTHNLGTKDVIVQLYDTVTDETVYADVERNSTSQVTITFAATPTNSIRVLVQKIG